MLQDKWIELIPLTHVLETCFRKGLSVFWSGDRYLVVESDINIYYVCEIFDQRVHCLKWVNTKKGYQRTGDYDTNIAFARLMGINKLPQEQRDEIFTTYSEKSPNQ